MAASIARSDTTKSKIGAPAVGVTWTTVGSERGDEGGTDGWFGGSGGDVACVDGDGTRGSPSDTDSPID
jgi:hypothetical protein